ncbi:MAG: GNAT family N-acetyltransferase [Elusimicrobiota bacterium]|jgi:GNAT superfamily N-acetyltransferase
MTTGQYEIQKIVEGSNNLQQAVLGAVDVQKELAIYDRFQQSGEKVASRGLLISGYSYADIVRFLQGGGFLLVGRKNDERVVGYLLMDPGEKFSRQLLEANIQWVRPDDRKNIEPILASGKYDYLDQIGVRFDFHGKGCSNELLRAAEAAVPGRTIITMIMTQPVENKASIRFFEKSGYVTFAKVHFSRYGTMSPFEGILLTKKV